MKYCKKCGRQLTDSARFCDKCGTPVDQEVTGSAQEEGPVTESVKEKESAGQQPAGQQSAGQQPAGGQSDMKNAPKPTGGLYLIIAVVGIFLAFFVLVKGYVRYHEKNKNADKNEQTESSEALENDVETADAADTDAADTDTSDQEAEEPQEDEIKEVDLFEGIDVTFEGIAPYGKLKISIVDDTLYSYNIKFTADKDRELSNGDEIKVVVTDSSGNNPEESLKEYYSVVPLALEKNYKVEGLASYIMSLDEIPESMMEKMRKQADETCEGKFESFSKEYFLNTDDRDSHRITKIASMDYIGEYFLTAKNEDVNRFNSLTMVYRNLLEYDWMCGEDHDKGSYPYYWCITYYDLMFDQEGVPIVDLDRYDCTTSRIETGLNIPWVGYGGFWHYGYKTLDDVYRDCVSVNLEKYNHEDHISDIAEENAESTEEDGAKETEENAGADAGAEGNEEAETSGQSE